MTALLARIRRTGKTIAHFAKRGGVTRPALSNVAYGRRKLSAATEARVIAAIEEEERRIEAEQATRERIATLAQIGLQHLGGINP